MLPFTGKECSRDIAKKKNGGVSRLGLSGAWQEGVGPVAGSTSLRPGLSSKGLFTHLF